MFCIKGHWTVRLGYSASSTSSTCSWRQIKYTANCNVCFVGTERQKQRKRPRENNVQVGEGGGGGDRSTVVWMRGKANHYGEQCKRLDRRLSAYVLARWRYDMVTWYNINRLWSHCGCYVSYASFTHFISQLTTVGMRKRGLRRCDVCARAREPQNNVRASSERGFILPDEGR